MYLSVMTTGFSVDYSVTRALVTVGVLTTVDTDWTTTTPFTAELRPFIHWESKKLIKATTLCLRKVTTFKLSVTLSNLNGFSNFLHSWKAYEICHKAHATLPTSCALILPKTWRYTSHLLTYSPYPCCCTTLVN